MQHLLTRDELSFLLERPEVEASPVLEPGGPYLPQEAVHALLKKIGGVVVERIYNARNLPPLRMTPPGPADGGRESED